MGGCLKTNHTKSRCVKRGRTGQCLRLWPSAAMPEAPGILKTINGSFRGRPTPCSLGTWHSPVPLVVWCLRCLLRIVPLLCGFQGLPFSVFVCQGLTSSFVFVSGPHILCFVCVRASHPLLCVCQGLTTGALCVKVSHSLLCV